jgi:histidine phosphotransfer protein HptB
MNDDTKARHGQDGRRAASDPAGDQPPEWTVPPALSELWEAGQSDVVMELIRLFLTDTTERLAQLEGACGSGDLDQVRRMAHSIKGSCSQMGEEQLALLSRHLEELAKAGALPESRTILGEITRQFELTRRVMQTFLESHT